MMYSLQAPTTQLGIINLRSWSNLIQLGKAVGCNMISPFVIKQCTDVLATPLCHLFNIYLHSSTIPQESWKIHKM